MKNFITQTSLNIQHEKRIDVTFDAPESSSDGGLLLLRQVDDLIQLTGWFAQHLDDERHPTRVKHARLEQLRQRVYQIAMGYEDCNDADTLRHDHLLKTVCGRLPDDPAGLSSQPTLSRFENDIRASSLVQLMRSFENAYVSSLPDDTEVVILDIDSTDDPTHGQQELSFFHGYYDEHMYHPLLLFDGEGQIISVLLRAGNTHSSRRALPLLERVIRRIKARLPGVMIVVRGDAGFCVPRILHRLEELNKELGDIEYILGIARNNVLLNLAGDAMAEAKVLFKKNHRTVRHFDSFFYAAKTWKCEHWIVVKAEHSEYGSNPRFVVSSLVEFPPRLIYDAYCQRGQSENYIKEFKNALSADRLSCHRFVSNAFRLLLHAAAYRLMLALREYVAQVSPDLGRRQFDTLRLRLLKVAAIVKESVRRILVRLPEAFPLRQVFHDTLLLLNPAPS